MTALSPKAVAKSPVRIKRLGQGSLDVLFLIKMIRAVSNHREPTPADVINLGDQVLYPSNLTASQNERN